MSGRKQHFIPKVLLKGFARQVRGSHRLWVQHRTRGTFESNVEEVAAARDFYSGPSVAGEPPNLDCEITRYENRLTSHLNALRNAPEGEVPTDLAIEVVNHLFFRTDAIRDLMSESFLTIQRAKLKLAEPATLLAYIGANASRPGRRFDEFIDYMRADPRWPAAAADRTRRQMRMLMFEAVRKDPVGLTAGGFAEALRDLEFLLSEHRALVREAHADALSGTVPDPPEKNRFAGLVWSVADHADDDLPLPDTVVVGSRDGQSFSSLPWVERDACRDVILPLASGRILQGQRNRPRRHPGPLLHRALVEGSRSFVVSRTAISGFDVARIGAGDRQAMDEVIDGAFSSLFTRPIGQRSSRRQIA